MYPPLHSHVQGHTGLVEPVYSTNYSCEPLPADWLAAWEAAAEPALHLPEPNPFISSDFSLLQVTPRSRTVGFSATECTATPVGLIHKIALFAMPGHQ